jgi:glycosyltransferase involved in cell wall biosynthesis
VNVLFLLRSVDSGGAERQLLTLARALQRAGHGITVAVFYGGGRLEPEFRNTGIEVVDLGKSCRWSAGFLIRLIGLVRRRQPHILHSYMVMPNLVAALLKFRFPRLPVVWGIRASAVDFSRFDRVSEVTFRLQRWLAWLPNLIIYNSQAGRAYHEGEGYPAARGCVVPNGFDTDLFRPMLDEAERVREAWGVPPGAPLVGLVGRIDPLKGHEAFLHAAVLMAARRPDVRFAIVGDGDLLLADSLRALAAELGVAERVVWAGYRSDMAAVYSALDIACLASITEGFPNMVGEAMACGVPCVATAVGDVEALMGETGIVVPPGDAEALARALGAVLEADLASVGAAARCRIAECFSPAALARRTLAVLQPLVQP